MSSTPKTIQIFLPSGEPHGISIAEITTRIVQVIRMPRCLLAEFLVMTTSAFMWANPVICALAWLSRVNQIDTTTHQPD
jgi:hypothetical protein